MSPTAPVHVAAETPLQDDVRRMVADLNADLLTKTPPELCIHLTVEQMADHRTTVLVARVDGSAVSMGALRRHQGRRRRDQADVDCAPWQGRGVGGQVLEGLLELARGEGLVRAVLETGDRHLDAWRLYERAGFRRCGVVLDYADVPTSVFYELVLDTRP